MRLATLQECSTALFEEQSRMYRLVYVSTAQESLGYDDVGAILDVSQSNNDERRITGFLGHNGPHFMQALEGEKSEVLEIYMRIGPVSSIGDSSLWWGSFSQKRPHCWSAQKTCGSCLYALGRYVVDCCSRFSGHRETVSTPEQESKKSLCRVTWSFLSFGSRTRGVGQWHASDSHVVT